MRPHSGGRGASFDAHAELAKPRLRRRSTADGFWARLDRNGPVAREGMTPCWTWTGRTNPDGYGMVKWCAKDACAHRVAYSLAHGTIARGMVVMHACDTPACCNPDHLSLGTIAQNNADARAKGRARFNTEIVQSGVANVNAKLTDAIVRELRAAWRAGESINAIARRTGLAVGTVHPMLHGKTWKHVTDQEAAA